MDIKSIIIIILIKFMSITTKEELREIVKEWLKYDTEISTFQTEIKTLKTAKKKLSDVLLSVMKEHNLNEFEINNGSIINKKTKVKTPINSKTLITILKDYDKEKAEEITEFILSNREEKIKETIKKITYK
jgi:prefoldin subunit 5